MPEPSAFLGFIKAVLWKHWLMLVLSGLPTVLVMLYEKWHGNELKFSSYIRWTLIGGAFIAVFLAWNDEYEARGILEKKESVFNNVQSVIAQRDRDLDAQKSLVQDRNNENHELKRQNDLLSTRLESLQTQLDSKDRMIRDLQYKLADKVARRMQSDTLAKFLDDGQRIKTRCYVGSTDSPLREVSDWNERVLKYLKSSMDSSHTIRFTDTIPPDAEGGVLANEKLATKECIEVTHKIDRKMDVIRAFLSEQNR